jgi:hypothetical protein
MSTNESGEPTGYTRALQYGMIVYVEEIGPMLCIEHWEGADHRITQEPGWRFERLEASLDAKNPSKS